MKLKYNFQSSNNQKITMQIVQKAIRCNFGTTVALFSGGPQHEKLAGQVIENLKKSSNGSVSFVGVIGQQNSRHFDHVYASSNVLNEHDFDRTRNQQQVISDSIIVPYRSWTHIKNKMLMRNLLKKNIFDDLSTKRVDCLITVGNFSLSKRLYTALNQYYKGSNRVRPPTFLFDSHIADRNVYNEQYLDFIFQRLPKMPDNMQRYVFPSMCIGYEGIFRAFQYLQKFKKDPSNSTYWSENFSFDVSELVKAARNAYRTSWGISQDNYVIALAPGEESKQIQFTFNNVIPGLSEFLASPKLSAIGNQFFDIFVILPENEEAVFEIHSKASHLPSQFKVHFVSPKQRYGALCAADFGILHNGQVTVEAAACQLPATVVDSMNDARAYLEYLFNGHVSPLNVSTNYHGYEQMLGFTSVTKQKLAYILTQHFERPKLRYYYAKLYREHIQMMLSKSGTSPLLDVSETGLEAASKKIIEVATTYKSLDHNARKTTQQRKDSLNLAHH